MSIKTSLKSAFPFLNGIKSKPALYREKIKYLGTPRLNGDAFNSWMVERIINKKPTCVCRLGSVELAALNHYIKHGGNRELAMSSKITNPLYICAGVFPENMEMFTGFAEAYLNSLPEVDLTGIWYNPGEQRLLKNNAKKTQFTELANLEPHYSTAPWPVHTPGLKVLVITSFVHSSRAQACELEGIWPQYDGLFKQCNFTFIQAPPHAALVPPKHKSWLEGLNDLKAQMDAVDYDILIVGAGAWGLPLAVHAKLSGKIGYHLGGATQLLFGIKGKRWDDHPIISKLYNEHWTRPLAEEVPQKKAIFENTEGTGYW